MLLSALIDKTLILNKTPRGVCFAVGFSLKNKSVKYLFCRLDNSLNETSLEFALPIDAIDSRTENAIILSRLRPVLPKSCVRLSLSLPVYNENGNFLGNLINANLQGYILSALHTDTGNQFSFNEVCAVSDAIIIRKPKAYPIGQPIPKKEAFVTKQTLKNALQNKRLIAFTLSLPPFEYTSP